MDNVKVLHETLGICERGFYEKDGERKQLKLNTYNMRMSTVYLPDEVDKLREELASRTVVPATGRCGVGCVNADSYELALKRSKELKKYNNGRAPRFLVLNFANPVNIGGGVRRGSNAQEEDLCRKSSLLMSLESETSQRYYEYNRSLKTFMGSDAVIVNPDVEVFRGDKYEMLDESFTVSVITCAAPMIYNGLEGMTVDEYKEMFRKRIEGILVVAASRGYEYLVLGAFGCGAFGNRSDIVAGLFEDVMRNFNYGGHTLSDFFRRIDFAVLNRSCPKDYDEAIKEISDSGTAYIPNFVEFYKHFGGNNYYAAADEKEKADAGELMAESERLYLDKIKGSLYGGAIGDALGYPVEFWDEAKIKSVYGESGITELVINPQLEKAIVSDDTQMTLFTATGILACETIKKLRGVSFSLGGFISQAYQGWNQTQIDSYVNYQASSDGKTKYSWLCDDERLFSRRAPGGTCLSALSQGKRGTVDRPINDSKGCGGIMRVAPVGLSRIISNQNIEDLDWEAAEAAAVTHGHPLGYMPAAVFAHIINRIVYPVNADMTLKDIVIEANEAVKKLFMNDENAEMLYQLVKKAIAFSEYDIDDVSAIHALGEGWVAEETLAIAIFCCLRYQNDFSKAVTASVNHKGDSDSTGAVTGNIMGALLGFDKIEDKWKENLELSDILDELSLDLCHGCVMSKSGHYRNAEWISKYIDMKKGSGETENTVFFCGENEPNGEFSNRYLSDFVIDDFKYFCIEQYFNAKKAKMFHDAENYTKILRCANPEDAKRFGREVKGYDDEAWTKVRYKVMKESVKAKFTQNDELKKKLLSTGTAVLAEAASYDTLWGIGLEEWEARKLPMSEWKGENLLGKILMEIRSEMLTENYEAYQYYLTIIENTSSYDKELYKAVNFIV